MTARPSKRGRSPAVREPASPSTGRRPARGLRTSTEPAPLRPGGGQATGQVHLEHELKVHQIELEMQAEELIRARAELEASLERYRDLYDFAPVGYVTLDAAGTVVEANLGAATLLGMDRGRLVGSPLSRSLSPASRDAFQRHRALVSEAGRRHACEVSTVRGDGTRVDLMVESVGVSRGLGSMRSALIDVSERKRAERALSERTETLAQANRALLTEVEERAKVQRDLDRREAEREEAAQAFLRERDFSSRLIDAAPAIVIALGVEGRILRLNSFLKQLSGYSSRELIGRDFITTFVPEEIQAAARERLARSMAGERARGLVFPIVLRNGEVREIDWHDTLLQNDFGETVGLVAIGQDVTDKLRAEEALRQAQKMEAVGTLASGVAHDFNNLLMGIIGCADLARSKVPVGAPAVGYLDQLKAAALGGTTVVNRLLSFARKEAHGQVVVDLNVLIGKMEALLRHLLGEDVTLRMSLAAANSAVCCQPVEIEQVLMNLSVNARHAMPAGGTLTIGTREEGITPDASRPGALPPGAYVILEVTDTGSGMDAGTLARIFEPFFTTKAAGSGTGLGLSTVYATVQQHGGHIEVQSAPGKGTRFTIRLPQSRERLSAVAPVPEAALGRQGGGETVLVVEDEPLVRMSARHYLERHGYHVLEAARDTEVDVVLAEHRGPLDLVVTDTVLPGLGGPRIAAKVQAARPGTPAILMSAHPNETLVAEGRIDAGTPTLQKPFTEEGLIWAVRAALARVPGRARQDEAPSPRSPEVADAGRGRPRVLFVEDVASAREAVAELLEEAGHAVTAVPNGALALDACHADAPDVVVTDLGLPDMSGAELALAIRGLLPGVGVVFVSGRPADDPEVSSLLLLPRTAYLSKPFDMARLEKAIDSLVVAAAPAAKPLPASG